MTIATQAVTDFTLEALQALYENNFPSKLPFYQEVKAALLDPGKDQEACQQKLQELLHVPVMASPNGKNVVYNWTGQRGAYRLTVPNPPAPAMATEETPREATQEPPVTPEQPLTGPGGPHEESNSPEPALSPQEAPEGKPGMFTALAALLEGTTLLMTISKVGDKEGEAVLIVNVVPKEADGKDSSLGAKEAAPLHPVSLEGTVSELDAHFLSAIQTKAEGSKAITQAIKEMKDADDALAEAKKKEAAAKKKEADTKSKNAQKKDLPLAAKEEKAEEKAQEAPKPQQEALF